MAAGRRALVVGVTAIAGMCEVAWTRRPRPSREEPVRGGERVGCLCASELSDVLGAAPCVRVCVCVCVCVCCSFR
jgi:hypothetical protein